MAKLFNPTGTADKESIANPTILNQSLSQCTVSCWVKSSAAVQLNPAIIIARDDNALGRGFYFGIANFPSATNLIFVTFTGTYWPSSGTSSGNFDARNWSHIAAQMYPAAAGAVGWANGSIIQALTGSQAIPASTGPTTIGYRSYSGAASGLNNVQIADLAFWNVALSDNEIKQLALGVRPPKFRSSNIIGYWPLTGGQPEIDLSRYHNNAIIAGNPLLVPDPPLLPYPDQILITVPTEDEMPALSIPPSFISGWSRQSNLPVIGGGTY